MEFSKAYYKMLNGEHIKMPSWEGYWAWENNTIMMHCKDGEIVDIRNTRNVAFTFGFIASNEWIVDDNSKEKVLKNTKPKFDIKMYWSDYTD